MAQVIQPQYRDQFVIGLFDIGDTKSCLYSWCCTPCALAEARQYLDGSSCCFNCLCLPLAPFRWLVRSAYNIGDLTSCFDDCVLSLCCPCCVVNQLYQTTSTYGNPTSNGGSVFNTSPMSAIQSDNNDSLCGRCLCAFFCSPCSIAKILEQSIGMPYMLACCCVNPFVARNFMRYQYRIKPISGSDLMDECFWPVVTYWCGSALSSFVPCVWCFVCGAYVALNMEMQNEASLRKSGETRRYLVGYNPDAHNAGVSVNPNYVKPGSVVTAPVMVVHSTEYHQMHQPPPPVVVTATVVGPAYGEPYQK